MPRTSRRTATTGLAWEALAPLVRWPLHSPRRLAALLAAVVAIAAVAGHHPGRRPVPPTPRRAPAEQRDVLDQVRQRRPLRPRRRARRRARRRPASAATSTPAVGVASSPGEVAVRFVTVWARPDLPVEAWRVDVTALATPEFGAQLATVLPVNVPARRVVGQSRRDVGDRAGRGGDGADRRRPGPGRPRRDVRGVEGVRADPRRSATHSHRRGRVLPRGDLHATAGGG